MIRTLVVDDDYMAASVHRSYTERIHGFEVVGEAHTGRETIELARRLRPDLILLDIYLPDISGLDVIRALREPGSAPVDVIAITSAKDVDTLRRAMQGGVIHYLVKPFFFDTFRERLRPSGRRRDGQRDLRSGGRRPCRNQPRNGPPLPGVPDFHRIRRANAPVRCDRAAGASLPRCARSCGESPLSFSPVRVGTLPRLVLSSLLQDCQVVRIDIDPVSCTSGRFTNDPKAF